MQEAKRVVLQGRQINWLDATLHMDKEILTDIPKEFTAGTQSYFIQYLLRHMVKHGREFTMEL